MRRARFVGRNTQYSGVGFADQRFNAIAMSSADFDAWVAKVRGSANALDEAAYAELAKPSAPEPVTYYAEVAPGLFDSIIGKYRGDSEITDCHDRDSEDPASSDAEKSLMLGRLTVDALPFYSPVAVRRRAGHCRRRPGGGGVHHLAAGVGQFVEGVADQRRSQAHRHHVCRPVADHAGCAASSTR